MENSNNLDLCESSRKDNPRRRFLVDADPGTESKLWMVWLVSPVGVKNFLAVGFVVLFAGNFACYKH